MTDFARVFGITHDSLVKSHCLSERIWISAIIADDKSMELNLFLVAQTKLFIDSDKLLLESVLLSDLSHGWVPELKSDRLLHISNT